MLILFLVTNTNVYASVYTSVHYIVEFKWELLPYLNEFMISVI